MKTRTRSVLRRDRGLAAATAAALLALVSLLPATAGAAAAKEPEPQLSIAVDNGETSARPGETLRYTITVKNLGTEPVAGLRVTQSLPPGLSFVAAGSRGAAGNTQVRWRLDLGAGSTTALRSTMKVTATPKTVLRLATVACAGLSADAPIVCATHSDQLPAGAAADAAAKTTPDSEQDDHRGRWTAAGVLVLAGLGLGIVTVRRRAAGRRAAGRRGAGRRKLPAQ